MRPIPTKIREQLASDPFMKVCIYRRPEAPNHNCRGRITFEHAIIVAGKQLNEPWAIVPCCEAHNSGEAMVKDYNRYIALLRATDEDLAKYPKANFKQLKKYLIEKYERNKI